MKPRAIPFTLACLAIIYAIAFLATWAAMELSRL
jgi:hypothetical protein